MAVARTTLAALGAVDADGHPTARGRAVSAIPADPRLARGLLDGAALVGARRAAEVVALLSDDVRAAGGDLVAALRALRRGGPQSGSWRAQVGRLRASVTEGPAGPEPSTSATSSLSVSSSPLLTLTASPVCVRAARRTYDVRHGRKRVAARAAPPPPWTCTAFADADRGAGRRDATIRSAATASTTLGCGGKQHRRCCASRTWWRGPTVPSSRAGYAASAPSSCRRHPSPTPPHPPGGRRRRWPAL